MNNYRIVVDAGHGGNDPGAISGNLREKDYTLRAANYMYNRFRELGVPVVITRDSDVTLTRQERLNTMRSLGTDPNVIILSNHINAGGGEGAEVVYPLRTSSTLPRMILEAIGEEGQIMRKYYQRRLPENPSKDYYYIMRETPNTTSLLIEYGFIDNINDQRKLNNYILDYAEAVVRAVSNYIGIPYNKQNEESITDTYTVKNGDTLYSISRRFNIPVDEIKRLNNLTSNTLTIGQTLILNEEVNIEPDPENGQIYTVQPGDTLFKIANNYDTTVSDIIDLNNLSTTILTPGQTLLLPNKSENTENIYIVKAGDTLYKIADEYNVTIDDIISSNNLTSTTLNIGKKLIIPTSTLEPVPTTPSTYTVVPGDTLYSIARRFNTTVDELKFLNNLTNNTLSIGEILTIPGNTLNATYKVKAGDNLYKIANTFNTTVSTLKEVNNLVSDILQIGQELIIP